MSEQGVRQKTSRRPTRRLRSGRQGGRLARRYKQALAQAQADMGQHFTHRHQLAGRIPPRRSRRPPPLLAIKHDTHSPPPAAIARRLRRPCQRWPPGGRPLAFAVGLLLVEWRREWVLARARAVACLCLLAAACSSLPSLLLLHRWGVKRSRGPRGPAAVLRNHSSQEGRHLLRRPHLPARQCRRNGAVVLDTS
jgi:hypothetical protein